MTLKVKPRKEVWFELEVLGSAGWQKSAAWDGRKWLSYDACKTEISSYNSNKELNSNQRIVKKTLITELISK